MKLLKCPSCGAAFPPDERFCTSCRMPLVYPSGHAAGTEPVDDRRARARKIKPQLAEGELVRIAGARNQTEGEFIQSLLLEEGVPSMLRRSAGFDVPDFLAAGPRDVLVPQAAVTTARDVLLQAELIGPEPAGSPVTPGRLLVGLLIALAVGAVLIWVIAGRLH